MIYTLLLRAMRSTLYQLIHSVGLNFDRLACCTIDTKIKHLFYFPCIVILYTLHLGNMNIPHTCLLCKYVAHIFT